MSRQQSLSQLEEQRPELQTWLRPLRVSLDALQTDPFRALVPLCAQSRAADAPLLHGAIIPLPTSAAAAHVRAVLHTALDVHARAGALDATRVLELAIVQDNEALYQLADNAGAGPAALSAGRPRGKASMHTDAIDPPGIVWQRVSPKYLTVRLVEWALGLGLSAPAP